MAQRGDSDEMGTSVLGAVAGGIFGALMVMLMMPFALIGMLIEALWRGYRHP